MNMEMTPKDIERISKALADPHRLRILQEIKQNGELQCACLSNVVKLSQPSISHHLKQLTEAGVVLSEKEGRNIKYTIDPRVVDGYIGFLASLK